MEFLVELEMLPVEPSMNQNILEHCAVTCGVSCSVTA